MNTVAPAAPARATALVFATSAAVLILEVLAGRLMAPYVGVSLETFTGIIGTVLAGIALGSWAGGALADRHDPARLLGPALLLGGSTSWMSLPILDALGPHLGDGPVAIVALTASAFLLPAAVLSAISPLVAKLQLRDLRRSGGVVGRLSAAGTLGALAGTYVTGFVLVAAAPTRAIVLAVGASLVLAGVIVTWRVGGRRGGAPMALVVVFSAVAGAQAESPCRYETGYFCVEVLVEGDDGTTRVLVLDGLRHAAVDLDDPAALRLRYTRLLGAVAAARPAGPLDTLHVGGGGFTFPRHLAQTRPGGTDLVLEIDPDLAAIARAELGLVPRDGLVIRHGDARLAVRDLDADRFDLVIGDAFAGRSVPWHLTTTEVVAEIDRVLREDGVYAMNVIDGGRNAFARAQLATLRRHFTHVAVIVPLGGVPGDAAVNQILLGSDAPLPPLQIAPQDGELVTDVDAFIGRAQVLRDDDAPVDQLVHDFD